MLNISTTVKAGLLIRQTHHWAANVFLAAIILHLFRIFFTGAYRKPREITYYLGVTMLMLALLEAFLGYSLVDDLMSGMGLVIGYSVGMSIPFVGANIMEWLFDGPFPGTESLWPRVYVAHVLLFPILIGVLLSAHLALVALKHHTQFRQRRGETEDTLVGVPHWPGQTPRSLGLLAAVAGVLFLLGGLVQINPIWLWGPYHTYASTNGAQPDWYLGWLIGGLRLMPGFDVVIGKYTLIPNAFWGGALFPLLVFGFLYFWPWVERRFTRDTAFHNLLDRPRDAPVANGDRRRRWSRGSCSSSSPARPIASTCSSGSATSDRSGSTACSSSSGRSSPGSSPIASARSCRPASRSRPTGGARRPRRARSAARAYAYPDSKNRPSWAIACSRVSPTSSAAPRRSCRRSA